MKKIIVTDKNPHIRELLSRELEKSGFLIFSTNNPAYILNRAYPLEQPDIVILDPDIIYLKPVVLLKKISRLAHEMLIIVHAFYEWHEKFLDIKDVVFIEKNGFSIKSVKNFIIFSPVL